jgi:GNAT acetyltransferase-like protein
VQCFSEPAFSTAPGGKTVSRQMDSTRGTDGSNPSSSSGESATNPRAGPGERCIGLATEAARGVLEYAWHKSRLSKVYAGDHPDNRASQRILEKLGFEFIGTVLYGPTGAVHDNRFLTDNRHFLT